LAGGAVNWLSEFCAVEILQASSRLKELSGTAFGKAATRKYARFAWRNAVFGRTLPHFSSIHLASILSIIFLTAIPSPLAAKTKEKLAYGEGLIVNIPLPEAEVEPVVEQVAENGMIRGTKEYNKDEYIAGAITADTSRVFPQWTGAGKVFYKVRLQALDPRNFKETNDSGTLEVRYVVAPQGAKNTVLRIDALFEEDFRHAVHQSNGSVETSEYKDIREHLDEIEVMKKQDAEAQQERQEMLAKKQGQAVQADSSSSAGASIRANPGVHSNGNPDINPNANPNANQGSAQYVAQANESGSGATQQNAEAQPTGTIPSTNMPVAQDPDLQTLGQRVQTLRKQVSRIVKSPGAPLKSAPFHTANTLQLLATGAEVLIVIDTPYWYGVETHEGQHGWIMRDELEQQP
jgi:polyhydroxyalkanoate synthesis regulator phasin